MESIYKPKYHTGSAYVATLAGRLSLVLFLYLMTRMVFFLYNRYLFPSTQWEDMWMIYRGGIRFDLSALGYVNGLYLFLALLPFPFVFSRFWQKLLKGVFLVFNAGAFIAQLYDFVYFRFTLKRTDFSFFSEFANDLDDGKLVWEALKDYAWLVLFWIAIIVVLSLCYGRYQYKDRPAFTSLFFVKRLATLCVVCLLTVVAIRGGVNRTTRPIAMSNAAAYTQEPIESALVLNNPFCIIRTIGAEPLEKLNYFSSEEALEAVYSPIHTASGRTHVDSLQKKNVVVIILESFSKEHIGFLNPPGHPSYTPFLDSLMASSCVWMNAYANGKKSIDAIPSVLGSIPTLESSFALMPYALGDLDGMGNLLKGWGYHTSFFHGAPNGSMGFDAMSRQLGFDHYYGKDEFNDNSQYDGVWGIWDEPFLQFFAKTLNSFPEPFVSAVFTVSSHHPFKVPSQYEGQFPKGKLPIHQCIGYTDNALRNFFHEASKMPWYPHTLFVLTADHGAYSQLYPQYQQGSGSMAIPILFYQVDTLGRKVEKVFEPAQQIDILPTVLHWVAYPNSYLAFGRSMEDSLCTPFVVHYPSALTLIRDEKEKESTNELFLKAFCQQYNNRLIENRLRADE